jgi:hypothetical protein
MTLNLCSITFMLLTESSIKNHVLKLPNKMGVERKHQHILNVGKALLFQSKLLPSFWSYAIVHVVFLINRVPSPLLKNQSPYFVLHHQLPNLNYFKVFGCLCYASTLQNHRINCNLELEYQFSWVTSQVLKAILFLILIPERFSFLDMLPSIKTYFPITPLLPLLLLIRNISQHLQIPQITPYLFLLNLHIISCY